MHAANARHGCIPFHYPDLPLEYKPPTLYDLSALSGLPWGSPRGRMMQDNLLGQGASMAVALRLLIVCTGNCIRSQMAEGWFRFLGGRRVEVFSAGTEPVGFVHPFAVRVMAESGIDISGGHSKHLGQLLNQHFDAVITVCDNAAESCPLFPGASRRLHWSIPDPSRVPGGTEARLAAFRAVGEQIRQRVERFLADELGAENLHDNA
jgi:arsenate reductase